MNRTILLLYCIAIITITFRLDAQQNDDKYWFQFGDPWTDTGVNIKEIISSDNDLYIIGSFTHIAGKPILGIGKYNSISDTWTDLDSGLYGYSGPGGVPRDFAVMPNGEVYVGDGAYYFAGSKSKFAGPINALEGAKFSKGVWSKYSTPYRAGILMATESGELILLGDKGYKWNGSSFQIMSEKIGGINNGGIFHEYYKTKGDNIYLLMGDTLDYNQYVIISFNTKTYEITELAFIGRPTNPNNPFFKINAMAFDDEGNIYIGGNFWQINKNNLTVNNIAKWDAKAKAWTGLGKGFDGEVLSLEIGINGELYAGGKFTKSKDINLNHVAVWDGNNWDSLGTGIDGEVKFIDVDKSGRIYFAGSFTQAGSKLSHYLARWDKNAGIEKPKLIVNSSDDKFDRSCDDDHCSLRDAIYVANLKSDKDTIKFNIKDGGSKVVIAIDSALPEIINPVFIDGATQPGASSNPVINIDGNKLNGNEFGFIISSDNCEIKKIIITRMPVSALYISKGADKNKISECWIGDDGSGHPDYGNKGSGIIINSSSNFIGGNLNPFTGNIISNNGLEGIVISGTEAKYNEITGNYIGSQTEPLYGNNGNGILIENSAHDNIIGKELPGSGNIIANNLGNGIKIEGRYSSANIIQNNIIGSGSQSEMMGNAKNGILIDIARSNQIRNCTIVNNDENGIKIIGEFNFYKINNIVENCYIGIDKNNAEMPNKFNGILIENSSMNIIGSIDSQYSNIICHNLENGIAVKGSNADANLISYNLIGLDINSTKRENKDNGISLSDSTNMNNIKGNYISGHTRGILIDGPGTTENSIYGNIIGLKLNKSDTLGNNFGIVIRNGANKNKIGSKEPEKRNIISGNNIGIIITGQDTKENNVYNNFIGTDYTGLIDKGNRDCGILLNFSTEYNKIGGDEKDEGNLISGNGTGIIISDKGTKYNDIKQNRIGTDINGELTLPNDSNGILIINVGSYNFIGGSKPGNNNIISGNGGNGIAMINTSNIYISCNIIGLGQNGVKPIPNFRNGVLLNFSSNINIGGFSSNLRNVISGNLGNGIEILGNSLYNIVSNNYIGTDSSGTKEVKNFSNGIRLAEGASKNFIGGIEPEKGNVISGNLINGITIEGSATSNNVIINNIIGLDKNGNDAIPNLTGISIYSSSNNIIGGKFLDSGNVISGNKLYGIHIYDSSNSKLASGNIIRGNLIGTNKSGNQPRGNEIDGINFVNAFANTIGGTVHYRNIISGNRRNGISITGTSTRLYAGYAGGNSILGNFIGLDLFGNTNIGNSENGIYLYNTAHQIIGEKGTNRNKIAFHSNAGILIVLSNFNFIKSNIITDNNYGIYMIEKSNGNKIIGNDILRNNKGYYEDNLSDIWGDFENNNIVDNKGSSTSAHFKGSEMKVRGNNFSRDIGNAITIENEANPFINKNNIFNNIGFGVQNKDETITINAKNNWWGHSSGPSGAGTGSGDKVSGNVDFSNWLEKMVSVVSAPSLDTLFIPAKSTDSNTIHFRNWIKTDDILDINITDSEGWLTSPEDVTLTLDPEYGGDISAIFTVDDLSIESVSESIVISSSKWNTDRDTTTFYIIGYIPELMEIFIVPDTVHLGSNHNYKFDAIGYDQQYRQMPFAAKWSATGGTIDTLGLFTSGNVSGEFKVTAEISDGSVKAEAIVIVDATVGVEEKIKTYFDNQPVINIYPNPFSEFSIFNYQLSIASKVKIDIYNSLGNKITTLVDEEQGAGGHNVIFNRNNIVTGVYYCVFRINSVYTTQKFVILD